MKRVNFTDGSGDYMIIGTAREIKSLENKCRKSDKGIYSFCTNAKYNSNKLYAFVVTYGNNGPWFTIQNEHTIVGLFMDGYIK